MLGKLSLPGMDKVHIWTYTLHNAMVQELDYG